MGTISSRDQTPSLDENADTTAAKNTFPIGSGRDCPAARILLKAIMLNSLIPSYPTTSKGFIRISPLDAISLHFYILLNM